jgi:anti-sigma B factor antagonist
VQSNSMVSIEIRWVNAQQAVVDLHGDFRMAAVASSLKRLLQVARKNPRVLVLNLATVQTMDTAGIAMLVEVFRTMQTRGGRLILAGLHNQVLKMVQLTHLDKVMDMCDSVEAALRSDCRGQGQSS